MAPDANNVHLCWMKFMTQLYIKPDQGNWKVIRLLIEKRKTKVLEDYIAMAGNLTLKAYPFYDAYMEKTKSDVLEMPVHMKWIRFFEEGGKFYDWESSIIVIADDDGDVIRAHFQSTVGTKIQHLPFFDLVKHHYEERPAKRIKTEGSSS